MTVKKKKKDTTTVTTTSGRRNADSPNSPSSVKQRKRKNKTYGKSDNTRKKGTRQGMLYDDYADDNARRDIESRLSLRSSSATRRETRRSSRSKTRKANEVIEILGSSSEEESSDEEEVISPGHNESNQFVEVSCDIAYCSRIVHTHTSLSLSQLAYFILFLSNRVQQSLPPYVT